MKNELPQNDEWKMRVEWWGTIVQTFRRFGVNWLL